MQLKQLEAESADLRSSECRENIMGSWDTSNYIFQDQWKSAKKRFARSVRR